MIQSIKKGDLFEGITYSEETIKSFVLVTHVKDMGKENKTQVRYVSMVKKKNSEQKVVRGRTNLRAFRALLMEQVPSESLNRIAQTYEVDPSSEYAWAEKHSQNTWY